MIDERIYQPQAAGVPGPLLAAPAGGIVPGSAVSPEARRFYVWLLAAFLVHGAVLTGFIASKPRQLGDPSGLDGAISISLVTEADLRGDATVADRAPGEPAPPPSPQVAPAPEPPAAQPSEAANEAAPADAPPEPAAPAATPAEPAMKPAIAPQAIEVPRETLTENAPGAGEPKPTETAAAKETPPPQAEPEPPAKEAKIAEAKPPAKASPAKPKDTKTAKLDLALPPPMQPAIPGGRGAGVERPAGITRSGENDMFARGVIRALQQTMPQLRDTRGRVKVKITLDKNGNLVSTQVLMPSNVAGLDQSVVFATRQTSFPLPPYKAVPADLIFVVTYIYK